MMTLSLSRTVGLPPFVRKHFYPEIGPRQRLSNRVPKAQDAFYRLFIASLSLCRVRFALIASADKIAMSMIKGLALEATGKQRS
jgi:hypothetical protein